MDVLTLNSVQNIGIYKGAPFAPDGGRNAFSTRSLGKVFATRAAAQYTLAGGSAYVIEGLMVRKPTALEVVREIVINMHRGLVFAHGLNGQYQYGVLYAVLLAAARRKKELNVDYDDFIQFGTRRRELIHNAPVNHATLKKTLRLLEREGFIQLEGGKYGIIIRLHLETLVSKITLIKAELFSNIAMYFITSLNTYWQGEHTSNPISLPQLPIEIKSLRDLVRTYENNNNVLFNTAQKFYTDLFYGGRVASFVSPRFWSPIHTLAIRLRMLVGNVSAIARLLGVSRPTVYAYIKRAVQFSYIEAQVMSRGTIEAFEKRRRESWNRASRAIREEVLTNSVAYTVFSPLLYFSYSSGRRAPVFRYIS